MITSIVSSSFMNPDDAVESHPEDAQSGTLWALKSHTTCVGLEDECYTSQGTPVFNIFRIGLQFYCGDAIESYTFSLIHSL